MQVILYDNVCTPCVRKPLWKQLKARAAEKRVLLLRKDVAKDHEAKATAAAYGISIPFIVDENNIAHSVEAWLA